MSEAIDELQAKHQEHIEKLQALSESEISRLKSVIKSLKQESADLKRENEELKRMVEEFKGEVEGLRGNFDTIQRRLGKIIVAEDDLVKLVKLSIGNDDFLNKSDVMATTLKYLKKINGADPISLSKMLDIPFNPPDRPISLSNSLLQSISAHLIDDKATGVILAGREEIKILLNEIIGIKMLSNEVSQCFLKNTRKALKFDLSDKHGNIMEWLIEELVDTGDNGFGNGIISSIISMSSKSSKPSKTSISAMFSAFK